MKLNRLQRYTAYCIMREEAERPMRGNFKSYDHISNFDGFCLMIGVLFGIDTYTCRQSLELCEVFPELANREPENHGDIFWFARGEWTDRIRILDECIQETHPDK